jgi:hypothetical protein
VNAISSPVNAFGSTGGGADEAATAAVRVNGSVDDVDTDNGRRRGVGDSSIDNGVNDGTNGGLGDDVGIGVAGVIIGVTGIGAITTGGDGDGEIALGDGVDVNGGDGDGVGATTTIDAAKSASGLILGGDTNDAGDNNDEADGGERINGGDGDPDDACEEAGDGVTTTGADAGVMT